jgi:hypothetical protein
MKKLTAVFFVIFLMAAALILPGWVGEHPTAAGALIVGAVLGTIGAALVIGVFVGVLTARRLMADGASIALKAQEVNDTWDAKKTAAFAGLMREGAVIGRQAPGALPALPMPGEAFSLPPLAEFGARREWDVIDNESEAQ